MRKLFFAIVVLCGGITCGSVSLENRGIGPTEEEPIGKRPYEMVRAGRDENPSTPLVDFENLEGWNVETYLSNASFCRSRHQPLWGRYVGHLRYRCAENGPEQGTPKILIKAPQPLPLPEDFDCVDFWIYGNNWEWVPVTDIPRVGIHLLFRRSDGEPVRIYLDTVRWKEWFLTHHRFTPHELESIGENAKFEGFEVHGGTNTVFTDLYFDDLCFYREQSEPLSFTPRPRRPITYPQGQTPGTNTGAGILPFPVREETLLPESAEKLHIQYRGVLESPEKHFRWDIYREKDDPKNDPPLLSWIYTPDSGTLADLCCEWNGKTIPSNVDSRIVFENGQSLGNTLGKIAENSVPPEVRAKWISLEEEQHGPDTVLCARWKYTYGDKTCEGTYRFRIWNRSLVVDFQCIGGHIREISLGVPRGENTFRETAFPIPYLVGNGGNRPVIRMFLDASLPERPTVEMLEKHPPIFHLGFVDHTRSNASEQFFGLNDPGRGKGTGVLYQSKTDGTRNDCFERFFFTFAPTVGEVLPTIPNPVSPWKHITGTRVWRAHGATDHEKDYEYWKRVHRYGIRNIIINDHETLWRDAGESFTFRTEAAPKKGGDPGQLQYTRKIHELGFYYGPYNNYTDYAPVNAYWDPDWVSRLPNGNYRTAWARCYNPKPQRAVEAESRIAEIVQEKFRFNTAYCDVHTAVPPWFYVDYDARVPGAGTFAATFYAYGEILLHQKATWGGPVYSEGNNHWYYSGLTDGNYAQDQSYFVQKPDAPWIVDFDLAKIHPLENNFGMGNLDMFYGRGIYSQSDEEYVKSLDRFIAATLAFGHAGFYEPHKGMHLAGRSYFLTQSASRHYGRQNVRSIRYADEQGHLLSTEQALASDAISLNRIQITYENGFTVRVNGNREQDWGELPPHGFRCVDPQGKCVVFSGYGNGGRFDFADSPDATYLDPRGHLLTVEGILSNGPLVLLKNSEHSFYLDPDLMRDQEGDLLEIIPIPEGPHPCTVFALQSDPGAEVIPLDVHGKILELGDSHEPLGRYSSSDGMLHISPFPGAFSYFVKNPKGQSSVVEHSNLVLYAVPGQKITGRTVQGEEFSVCIPENAVPGTIHWTQQQGRNLGFIVRPPCEIRAEFEPDSRELLVFLRSNYEGSADFQLSLQGVDCETQQCRITGNSKTSSVFSSPRSEVFRFSIPDFPEDSRVPFEIRVQLSGADFEAPISFSKPYHFDTRRDFRDYGTLEQWTGKEYEIGYARREQTRRPCGDDSGAYAYHGHPVCGGKPLPGWEIHPPYVRGVGYTYMRSEPFTLTPGKTFELISQVGIRDGGDASDGILYRILVVDEQGREHEILSHLQKERSWTEFAADLSPWSGQRIRLLFLADVGPGNDSTADWACWSFPRIRSREPVQITTLIPLDP